MNRTPETVALMNQVADHIEAFPERYDQEVYWITTECGTVGCIAGWADRLSGYDDPLVAPSNAEERLGLTLDEGSVLFDEAWRPAEGLTVPDALRKLAGGADLEDVTHEDFVGWPDEPA